MAGMGVLTLKWSLSIASSRFPSGIPVKRNEVVRLSKKPKNEQIKTKTVKIQTMRTNEPGDSS